MANKIVFMMENIDLCSSFTESSRAAMRVGYRISQRNIMNIIPENWQISSIKEKKWSAKTLIPKLEC